jgi:hypothetical protein
MSLERTLPRAGCAGQVADLADCGMATGVACDRLEVPLPEISPFKTPPKLLFLRGWRVTF